jgi:RimJ/RimL family protein N-acetyltransferase
MSVPVLRKARIVRGRSIVLRNATTTDAAFIVALRTDESRSQHVSKTSPALSDQEAWLLRYATRSDEAYFIIESQTGEAWGTVRLYDAMGDSFCWGSWIMKSGAPSMAAIESAMLVYSYALDHLGFAQAHFQVRKDNERVWMFHERFGAARVAERDDEYDYSISHSAIRKSMQRYSRYLPEHVAVEN